MITRVGTRLKRRLVRRIHINLAKLLTLKGIRIPEGTRMVIEMYPDKDSQYGHVVGLKLKDAQFVPKKSRKSGKPAGQVPSKA